MKEYVILGKNFAINDVRSAPPFYKNRLTCGGRLFQAARARGNFMAPSKNIAETKSAAEDGSGMSTVPITPA